MSMNQQQVGLVEVAIAQIGVDRTALQEAQDAATAGQAALDAANAAYAAAIEGGSTAATNEAASEQGLRNYVDPIDAPTLDDAQHVVNVGAEISALFSAANNAANNIAAAAATKAAAENAMVTLNANVLTAQADLNNSWAVLKQLVDNFVVNA